MTQEELIAKITKENYELKEENKEYIEMLRDVLSYFYAIGGPLNDNVLGFDKDQRIFLSKIAKEIEYVLPRRCDCE